MDGLYPLKNEKKTNALLSVAARHKDLILIVLVIILAFTVRYYDIMGAGITWDEPFYVHAGITYVNNLMHLNFSQAAWIENTEHPPVSKYIYGIAIMLFNRGAYDLNAFFVSKVVSAAMGTLTCVVVYLIGREFFGRRIGAVAALILSLIPVFLAHNQQAAIDTPVALLFTVTMCLFLMAVKHGSKAMYAASAVSFAIMFDIKYIAVIILPILAIVYILHRREQLSKEGMRAAGLKETIGLYMPPIKHLIVLGAIIAVLVYLLFPWIWLNPINLGRSIFFWKFTPYEFFLGQEQRAPIYYYPVYFLVTTPLLLFVPMAAGVMAALRSKDKYHYAMLLWAIVPFGYGLGMVVQNNMRYLLMIYPAVAILCAMGIAKISDAIIKAYGKQAMKNLLFAAVTAGVLVYLFLSAMSVHPYYLDYYNLLSGGPKNVYDNRLFEFGWWGEGIYDCVKYVDASATANTTVFMAAPNHFVGLYGKNATYIGHELPPHGSELTIDDTDYIITNVFAEKYLKFTFPGNYTLVHQATVQGAPLAKVYKKAA
jgi:hypothetical protein